MNSRFQTLTILAVAAMLNLPASAQKAVPGGFTYWGAKVTYRANGVRMEGNATKPATIQSPQLSVTANVIAFDLQGTGIQEVRATGGVNLKLNLSSKAGGPPAHVEVTAGSATLVPGTRKLILKTNVNGFYQVQGGPRNTIKGSEATLSYLNQNLAAYIAGGQSGVVITIPPEPGTKPGAIGTVVVTARRVTYDGQTGVGRFTGNAKAVSTDGPNKFEVTAPEFLLSRGADGSLSELTTVGRTAVKIDLPPDPAPATGTAGQMGTPTRVEATADTAIVNRVTTSLIFKGNVKGFYRLKPADGPARDYNFAGAQATFRHSPTAAGDLAAGLNVEVTGEPVTIEAPGFDLGL